MRPEWNLYKFNCVTRPGKTRVLFVCIGNACRSPMAEAIARKDADDVIEPFSAGVFPLGVISETTHVVLEVNEYPTEGLASKGLQEFPPHDIDLVINMSGLLGALAEGGYPLIEHWEVADPYGANEGVYQRVLGEIQGHVRGLADRLREERRAKAEQK